jgi:C1A family cysteine protease
MFTASRPRYRIIFAALAACVLFSISLAQASEGEVAALNRAIQAQGAQWVAGETSLTSLSPDARKRRLGALKPLLTDEDHKAAAREQAALAEVTPPASYDWRATATGNWVTPVRNQGNCGSCWAFATTAAAESQTLMSNNTPGLDLNLAEQLLVSCSPAGNCNGGYISTASNYIRDLGLPVETCFPYTATNNSCSNACQGWTNNSYHIAGWHWVVTTAPTVEALKSALVTYGPLVTTMDVYSDFFSYRSGIYRYVSGTYQGGHAILIVGYDDPGQYFIVKNSWGTGWGEAGYFRIAYSQLSSVVDFGAYTIADEGGNPAPPPPPPPSCTYSISPTSKSFKAAGGSGVVTLSTQDTCDWTAVSNVTWVNVTSGASGNGSGSVSYTVEANATNLQRSGTMTIAGQTFTVNQQAARSRGK